MINVLLYISLLLTFGTIAGAGELSADNTQFAQQLVYSDQADSNKTIDTDDSDISVSLRVSGLFNNALSLAVTQLTIPNLQSILSSNRIRAPPFFS